MYAKRKAAAGAAPLDHSHEFEVPSDLLVVAVGSQTATFGIPGVQENCFFIKTMSDARALRAHMRCARVVVGSGRG